VPAGNAVGALKVAVAGHAGTAYTASAAIETSTFMRIVISHAPCDGDKIFAQWYWAARGARFSVPAGLLSPASTPAQLLHLKACHRFPKMNLVARL